jgi:hypothetical protein
MEKEKKLLDYIVYKFYTVYKIRYCEEFPFT